jgi:predicted pyridoxine 5'-phosphate oxidase superfamily flavin-nucleotide-binding protein
MAELVTIPQDVQEFIKGKMAWVGTASKDGTPNATPKGSVQVLDGSHLMFADLFSRKTRENLKENPQVSVTVIDPATSKGYQFKGAAELIDSGPLFEKVKEQLKQAPRQLPPPVYVVRIAVDAIFDQSVGPDAGKRIV